MSIAIVGNECVVLDEFFICCGPITLLRKPATQTRQCIDYYLLSDESVASVSHEAATKFEQRPVFE